MKKLGEKLIFARKRQKMTQSELAMNMNVARTTISNWENGRSEPDFESLQRLTEVLHYDFFGEKTLKEGKQQQKLRRIRLNVVDQPVIEVVSEENAGDLSEGAVDFRIFGSGRSRNAIEFHVSAVFSVIEDGK